jgi:hypothetical protein
MSVRPIFAWYDLWVGAFWDQAKRRLYLFPIPMFGLVIQFRQAPKKPVMSREPRHGWEHDWEQYSGPAVCKRCGIVSADGSYKGPCLTWSERRTEETGYAD